MPKVRPTQSDHLRGDHMHHLFDSVLNNPAETSTSVSSNRGKIKKTQVLLLSKARRHTSTPRMPEDAIDKGSTTTSLQRRHYDSSSVGARFVPPPAIGLLGTKPPLNGTIAKDIISRFPSAASNVTSRTKSRAFPFLRLPPEIRNAIYRILLTANVPIELPRITRDIATRAREWAKCRESRTKRAKFKTLFLEVLETCKQVYDEGSSVFYGCNVFKFRSCHSEGPKTVLLPTRHLCLLKNIKVSVISREPYNGQDKLVANLLQALAKDEIQLDTFELSWYGWMRYQLRRDGLVCHALQLLQVEKRFTVKVLGEARMQIEMVQQLQQNIRSWKVEIHRPINAVTGAELSDRE